MRLKDKVVLVTGAGSGIGKETALLFAKEGTDIALLGRTKEELEKVCCHTKTKSIGSEAFVY